LKDSWILLGGRAALSDKVVQDQTLTRIADFPEFFAFVNEFSIERLNTVLLEIVRTENIHLNLGGPSFLDIRLRVDQLHDTLSCFPPMKFDRSTGQREFGSDRIGFRWTVQNGTQITQLGAGILERASELLRFRSHVNGVEALAAEYTPGLLLNYMQRPELQVVACFPFEFNYTHDDGVHVKAPETVQIGQLSIKVFFRPPIPSITKLVIGTVDQFANKAVDTTWKFEWPEGADYADVRLFYGERQIDLLAVNRWAASASIRGAINEYFDSNHNRLRDSLRWKHNSKSDEFEFAVVRLLNILGIPTTWYGRIVTPDRPDAVGIILNEESVTASILLIECAREKPAEKFSALAERARQLSASIPGKDEVVPVVFTPARVIETELAEAVEYGVCLIGAEEINQLLEFVALRGITADSVLTYLKRQMEIPIGRFASGW
jgi:hypothetical protein